MKHTRDHLSVLPEARHWDGRKLVRDARDRAAHTTRALGAPELIGLFDDEPVDGVIVKE